MEIYDKNFYLCKGYKLKQKETRPLIFFHVPKCAGTTIFQIIQNLISPSMRLSGSATNENSSQSAYELFENNRERIVKSNFNFISGHYQFEIKKHFQNYLSATILRDPVERLISHYNFIVDRGYISAKTNLEECFKKNYMPTNIMTQIFSCENNNDTFINEDKYSKALKVLTDEVDLVFDSYDTNKLLNRIISMYDLPNLFFQYAQKTKNKYFIKNDENIDIIKKFNQYDIKLYDYMKNKKLFTLAENFLPERNKDQYYNYSFDIFAKPEFSILNEKQFTHLKKAVESRKFKIIIS